MCVPDDAFLTNCPKLERSFWCKLMKNFDENGYSQTNGPGDEQVIFGENGCRFFKKPGTCR
jgi:hypothetical protein